MLGRVDPYYHLESSTSSSASVEWYEWPEVTYADIYKFLINTTSYCTHEQLKAHKSLDGYNFFVNGWVTNITVIFSYVVSNNYSYVPVVDIAQSRNTSSVKVSFC